MRCKMLPASQVSPASRNLDPVCPGIERAPGFVSEEDQSFPEQGEKLILLGCHSLVTIVTAEMGAEQNEQREADVLLICLNFRVFCTFQKLFMQCLFSLVYDDMKKGCRGLYLD